MKILDYLYYKIYRANLIGSAKDIAEFVSAVYLSLLIFINLIAIEALLRKLNLIPFFLKGKRNAIILITCLILINSLLFFYKKRYKKIILKYQQENEKKRKTGNFKTWLYIIISIIFLIIAVYYKPGQL